MEVMINNEENDAKNRLKEIAKERKMIVKEIYKFRDEVFRECDKVLAKKSIV